MQTIPNLLDCGAPPQGAKGSVKAGAAAGDAENISGDAKTGFTQLMKALLGLAPDKTHRCADGHDAAAADGRSVEGAASAGLNDRRSRKSGLQDGAEALDLAGIMALADELQAKSVQGETAGRAGEGIADEKAAVEGRALGWMTQAAVGGSRAASLETAETAISKSAGGPNDPIMDAASVAGQTLAGLTEEAPGSDASPVTKAAGGRGGHLRGNPPHAGEAAKGAGQPATAAIVKGINAKGPEKAVKPDRFPAAEDGSDKTDGAMAAAVEEQTLDSPAEEVPESDAPPVSKHGSGRAGNPPGYAQRTWHAELGAANSAQPFLEQPAAATTLAGNGGTRAQAPHGIGDRPANAAVQDPKNELFPDIKGAGRGRQMGAANPETLPQADLHPGSGQSAAGSVESASPPEQAHLPREMQTDTIRQIVQHMALRVDSRQSSMHISLKPEFLGDIRMHVMTENQHVTIRMTADSHLVREIIQQNVHQLRHDLQQHGLHVDKVDVVVDQDNDGWKQGQGQGGSAFRQEQQNRSFSQGRSETRTEPNESAQPAFHAGSGRRSRSSAQESADIDFFA